MPDLDLLTEGIKQLLTVTDSGIGLYVGGVVDPAGRPVNPPTISTTDRRIAKYMILWPDAGQAIAEQLDGGPRALDYGCQVTCVAADTRSCLAVVSFVREHLAGQRIPGFTPQQIGLLTETTKPGPPREDRDTDPSRWFVPLLYATTAT